MICDTCAHKKVCKNAYVSNEEIMVHCLNYDSTLLGYWTRELIRNEKGGCIGAKMICSYCGQDNEHDEYMQYCPNCGKKMKEKLT